ncbi:MAG: YegP family protein [Flavobacteriales bacterium]|nr:YegP family protein [Flavobacteriales bacterium]
MMATFELYNDKAEHFRFRLKAGNGEIILASQGYSAKASAMNGIESVKKNAGDDANYECKSTDAGHSFNLLAANQQVIGSSQVYTTESSRDNGIESVKSNAPTATVLEILTREIS